MKPKVEYVVDTIIEHPRATLNLRAGEGYELHSIATGFFDDFGVWREIGYTIIFCRAVDVEVPRPTRRPAAGVA